MAYYTLQFQKGYLARRENKGFAGKLDDSDLREAEEWADAEVDQLVAEVAGARNAPAIVAALRASPPPEIQAIACLAGSAEVLDRVGAESPQIMKRGQVSYGQLLRDKAKVLMDRIRKRGSIALGDGTFLSLAAKRKRGIQIENPKVRAYPLTACRESHGVSTTENLETIFLSVNLPAPIL